MNVRIRKKILVVALVLFALSGLIATFGGSNPPGAGSFSSIGTISDPNGKLKQINVGSFQPFNGTDNPSTHTITFEVLGFEPHQPAGGLVFNVTTTGSMTVKFVSSQPRVICQQCSFSYAGNIETVSYSGAKTDMLIVVWTPASGLSESQSVLFRDDFLYTNPEIQSSWIIDTYQSPSSNPGEFTSSGYLNMRAQPTSGTETVHVSAPSFTPSAYAGQSIFVKRKLTVTEIPFSKKEISGTANLRVGFAPLLTTGAYPGASPANSPNTDSTNNCALSVSSSDNVGLEYLNIGNDGGVNAVVCGDPSGSRTINFLETVDPTLYTVVTVETFGLFCSTCTDNVAVGLGWVYFRVYQEDSSGRIITSTDKNINYTSGIAPYFQTNYVFLTQLNNNGAVTSQLSKIDMVQLQNYGSPVCLVAFAGFLCTKLPIVPPGIIGNQGLVGLIAWLANQIGFGDEQSGAVILFVMFSFMIGFVPWWFTKNVSVGAFGEEMVLGFFVYVGFLPIWTLILVFLGGAAIVVMIVMRFLGGSSMMAGERGVE